MLWERLGLYPICFPSVSMFVRYEDPICLLFVSLSCDENFLLPLSVAVNNFPPRGILGRCGSLGPLTEMRFFSLNTRLGWMIFFHPPCSLWSWFFLAASCYCAWSLPFLFQMGSRLCDIYMWHCEGDMFFNTKQAKYIGPWKERSGIWLMKDCKFFEWNSKLKVEWRTRS